MSKMKKIYKMRITLDITEEKISELEDLSIEIIHYEIYRNKKRSKNELEHQWGFETISSSLICV